MATPKDPFGNDLPGYIAVGGMGLHRATLARALPDIQRFERCLADAQRVTACMVQYGRPPADAHTWSATHTAEVQTTMREIGAIHEHALTEARATVSH